jgi:hypothetical protein
VEETARGFIAMQQAAGVEQSLVAPVFCCIIATSTDA